MCFSKYVTVRTLDLLSYPYTQDTTLTNEPKGSGELKITVSSTKKSQLIAVSRFTKTDRNGPKRTYENSETSRSTKTGLNKGRVGQGTARQGWGGTYFVPTYLLPT